MAFLFVANGVIHDTWTPATEGTDYALPATLEPLASVKDDILVLTNLAQMQGSFNVAGDHARGTSCFLTGVRPVKTEGADIHLGISVDQVAANKIGGATRLPSLELGTVSGKDAGNCDSGYSCAYSSNISWRGPSQPMAKEANPKLVFERLFGNGDAAVPRKQQHVVTLHDGKVYELVVQASVPRVRVREEKEVRNSKKEERVIKSARTPKKKR